MNETRLRILINYNDSRKGIREDCKSFEIDNRFLIIENANEKITEYIKLELIESFEVEEYREWIKNY